jgi:exodeoxyribonuclease-3
VIRVASWNVNSLRVRLSQLLQWLERQRPDIVCLQETKLEDHIFPVEALKSAGYLSLFNGQKAYNGVAILSRTACRFSLGAIPDFVDPQKRVLAVDIGELRIICVYVPNGQSVDSDKYRYKLAWLNALTEWLRVEVTRHSQLIIAGDFNIAPAAMDVYDATACDGRVLFSALERESFAHLLGLGFADGFRLFEQAERSFTWWDYRMNAFKRGMGLRIDHVLLSTALAERCKSCEIDVAPRRSPSPSDHAPIFADFDF